MTGPAGETPARPPFSEPADLLSILAERALGIILVTPPAGVMEVDDEIRELVLVGASAVELKKKAIERGMITLRRSGLIKVAAGMTTLEEVARETIH